VTPYEFVEKWHKNTLGERQGAQSHLLDLSELLGVEKPFDPDNYCIERGAIRTGAGSGWADVSFADGGLLDELEYLCLAPGESGRHPKYSKKND
jgi:hypothetical protein